MTYICTEPITDLTPLPTASANSLQPAEARSQVKDAKESTTEQAEFEGLPHKDRAAHNTVCSLVCYTELK